MGLCWNMEGRPRIDRGGLTKAVVLVEGENNQLEHRRLESHAFLELVVSNSRIGRIVRIWEVGYN